MENILKKGKETKRKLATGTVYNILMSDRSNSVQYSTRLNLIIFIIMQCRTCQTFKILTIFSGENDCCRPQDGGRWLGPV